MQFFVYDDNNVLFDFVDPDGDAGSAAAELARSYFTGPAADQVFAQENFTATGSDVLWQLTDNLGSVRDLVDSTGTVVAHFDYDAFGVPTPATLTAAEDVNTRYLYTAREYDAATGLQYNRARWYDPVAKRWLSLDPIGFQAGDTNLYRYVGNHPTYATDPSGMIEPEDYFRLQQYPSRRSSVHPVQSTTASHAPTETSICKPKKHYDRWSWNYAGIGGDHRDEDVPVFEMLAGTLDEFFGWPQRVIDDYNHHSVYEPIPDVSAGEIAFFRNIPVVRGTWYLEETYFGVTLGGVEGGRPLQGLDRLLHGIGGAAELAPVAKLASGIKVAPASNALRPSNFGVATIAEDASQLRMWNDAMRSAASSSRSNGYTRYLEALDRGHTPTQQMLEEAFSAVNSRYLKSARAAGLDVAEVHHWNFSKTDFPTQIVDPRHLVPVQSRALHETIHRATTGVQIFGLDQLTRYIEFRFWSGQLH